MGTVKECCQAYGRRGRNKIAFTVISHVVRGNGSCYDSCNDGYGVEKFGGWWNGGRKGT